VEHPLFTEPFVGYVGTKHRLARHRTITASDLSLDDLWLLSEGHCFRTQTVQLCSQRGARGSRSETACTIGARFESGNLETLKRLVERGTGMTLLPALATHELRTAAERRCVRPFAAPAPSREVRLVRRRAYLKRHLLDALVTCLLDTLPGELMATSAGARGSARRT
jgi:LysR family hydrogen peroxide-inducible transcriptional activator